MAAGGSRHAIRGTRVGKLARNRTMLALWCMYGGRSKAGTSTFTWLPT